MLPVGWSGRDTPIAARFAHMRKIRSLVDEALRGKADSESVERLDELVAQLYGLSMAERAAIGVE